jgi:pimeloyl-ACP methyl ester carboxylesterase
VPAPAETRYAKSGDVHIAYQVVGAGPLDLVFVPGFVSNVEAAWESPGRARFFHRLASFSRLILFDKRDTGLSDRSSQLVSSAVKDLVARSGIEFEDCGVRALKGVPGEWHLLRVASA